MRHRFVRALSALLLLAAVAPIARAAPTGLQANDRVAIIGDSITEQKLYSVYMEAYFIACKPAENVTAINVGWSGETSWGLLARIDNELWPFKPTVATTCYGMNDGGYAAYDEARGTHYRESMDAIVKALKEHGVRVIAAGSPGPVDSTTYKRNPDQSVYNATLSKLGDLSKSVAEAEGVTYAPMNETLNQVMVKAKAEFGNDYVFLGGDGVHPQGNGHLAMAYVMLKSLGVTGDIGTITVDASGKATATDGHKVLSSSDGAVEIESTRYPFCTYADGNPKNSNMTRPVAEILNFAQELSRLNLVVAGASGSYRVTWGETSKSFTGEQLAKGINLSAEFPDNPFSEPFKHVLAAVNLKQGYETYLVKSLMHARLARDTTPEQLAALEPLISQGMTLREKMVAYEQGAVRPVRHTIKIEKVQ